MSNFPGWLKSIQNGSIGEIRTKSFLMDRFWILERSVDIESVDFLIQRRLYGKNILDQCAPRFGVVQAKFSQDEKTVHRINKEHILGKDGNPHIEFFLIVHTGDEEDQKMFLLTAKDISEDFHVNADKKYEVSSRIVFASSNYRITSKKTSLDRIENSIQCAEFYKNRSFIFSGLTSAIPDFDAMLPEFKEEIGDDWSADIPALFKERKKEAFGAMLQIEKIHALLKGFAESIDPLEACCIAQELAREGRSLSLPEIFHIDFYYDSKNFKEMVHNLRNDGALDNYVSTRKSITDAANGCLQDYPTDQISNNTILEIVIDYDPVDFRLIRVTNDISDFPEDNLYDEFSKILEAQEGRIILSWKMGLYFSRAGHIGMDHHFVHEIMEKMYALKYYEDEEIVMISARQA